MFNPASLSPSIATASLALALVLSGCGGDEQDATNNTTSDAETCTGKCDSTDPADAFRPLVALTLVDGEPSEDADLSGGDAGMSDAGTSDAGMADTGSTDASSTDAGLADAGSTDAGVADAGSADAGSTDAGSTDAGSTDAGTSDATFETFHLVAAIADDHLDDVDDAQTLSAKLWTTVGETTSEEPMLADLSFNASQSAFTSQTIDAAELAEWDTLTVKVSGDIGGQAFEQLFEFAAGETDGAEIIIDPWADARDVDMAVIEIDPAMDAPDYPYPSTDAPFGLSGTEFWQKWPGGHNPTYSYSEGTKAGQKCMSAAALRFEAIMADPPEALVELEETSNWSGRFFNWNDDFSHADANGSPNGAVLWAWRTHLIKWISQTGDDGRCHLPTRGLVERAAASCLRKAEQNDGEIQGCQAY